MGNVQDSRLSRRLGVAYKPAARKTTNMFRTGDASTKVARPIVAIIVDRNIVDASTP